MADLNARDAKLVQFLNEAHAKEAELEADLTAHISLTEKAPYKKRLQQHLKETRDHKRRVASRIKALGGSPSAANVPLPVPDAVGELAGKGIAAVKGQVGLARAAITEQSETHLRNAREELREEYVEIGTYTAIESLASEVGDRETAQLAKSIRRDEQKTADYLERLIPQLVKDLVRAEIPRNQRATSGGSRRRASSARKRSSTTSRSRSRSSSSSRKRSGGSTSRKSTARKSTARKSTARKSTARKSTARKSTARKSAARKSTARTSTARKSTARKTARKSTARKTSARS
jgi:ferritin-like metal-binding protein YciE